MVVVGSHEDKYRILYLSHGPIALENIGTGLIDIRKNALGASQTGFKCMDVVAWTREDYVAPHINGITPIVLADQHAVLNPIVDLVHRKTESIPYSLDLGLYGDCHQIDKETLPHCVMGLKSAISQKKITTDINQLKGPLRDLELTETGKPKPTSDPRAIALVMTVGLMEISKPVAAVAGKEAEVVKGIDW